MNLATSSTLPDPASGLDLTPNPESVPIPWSRFTPSLIFAISHTMTYAVIFPFISDMITSFGVLPERVGLYAGIAEGVMMLVEVIVAPVWARLADRFGRRPVMLTGFSITVIACPMLGFSSTVWQVVVCRACLGLNSAGVMTNLIAAELSHPSNRSKIFAFLAPSFCIGLALGTLIGGQLAHPFGRLPSFLGGTGEFWLRHPYALPCLVVAIIDAAAILNGWCFLPETRRSPSLPLENPGPLQPSNRWSSALRVPGFFRITIILVLHHLCSFSWDGLYTVFTYAQPAEGGLGLSVDIIGLLYSASYLVTALTDPILLPPMERRWGLDRALGAMLVVWPLIALSIPLSQWTAVHARPAMWGVLTIQLSGRAVGSIAWTVCDIIAMDCFDDCPDLMATGSAISLIGGAGGRALGTVIAGWLFSRSTQYPASSLLRQIPWIYIAVVAMAAVVFSRMTRRTKPPPFSEESQSLLEAAAVSSGYSSMPP